MIKIIFRFENSSSEIELKPSDARDKQYLDLCVDGRPEIKLKPTKEDGIILCFSARDEKKLNTNNKCFDPACIKCGLVFREHEDMLYHMAEEHFDQDGDIKP